ncbi:hypothetical protein [Pedobacter sp.]|uniref:hypothetical protein n=1 Tax=Pedobacter sp. TaxID=1411316 RepID=UPI0031D30B78
MTKKFITPLHHFAFNRTPYMGSLNVEWFYYGLNPASEENIRGFTDEEIKLFERFVLANNLNFAGDKNVHPTNEGDAPMEFYNDRLADEFLKMPSYLLLTPNPQLIRTNAIANLMEIILLTDKQKQNHQYDLPFGALGKVSKIY